MNNMQRYKIFLSWLTIIYECESGVSYIFLVFIFYFISFCITNSREREIIFHNRQDILQWNESNNSFILGKMKSYEKVDKVVPKFFNVCLVAF